MVPVVRARRSVEVMKAAGAQVIYCESQGGHKVSRECLEGMEIFFQGLIFR
jgi:predicted esterase